MTSKPRSDKCQLELALIQGQADMHYEVMGYWTNLNYEMRESAFHLERIMAKQPNPDVARKLNEWGQRWGILKNQTEEA